MSSFLDIMILTEGLRVVSKGFQSKTKHCNCNAVLINIQKLLFLLITLGLHAVDILRFKVLILENYKNNWPMKNKLSTRPNHCPAQSDSHSSAPALLVFLLNQGTFCHRHQILVCWCCAVNQ